METKAETKTVRISAFKAREVARHIQGLPAQQALDLLRFSPQKAAFYFGKTLKSAIANAENNNNLSSDTLYIKEATVGEGPTFKRFRAKARGSAGPIRKRTSHFRIILEEQDQRPEDKKKTSKPKAAKAKTTAKKQKDKTTSES